MAQYRCARCLHTYTAAVYVLCWSDHAATENDTVTRKTNRRVLLLCGYMHSTLFFAACIDSKGYTRTGLTTGVPGSKRYLFECVSYRQTVLCVLFDDRHVCRPTTRSMNFNARSLLST